MELILHDYRRCPFCIRVRMVMVLKDIPCVRVEERLRHWSDWMLHWAQQHNTRPRVPVLENPTEKWALPESFAIAQWLDEQSSPHPRLTDTHPAAYQTMTQWWQWCDETLKPAIDRFKYGIDRCFDSALHPQHTAALKTHLEKLESTLVKHPFLMGETLSMADIGILPFVRQIIRTREQEFDFSLLPHTIAWAKQIIASDWFANQVMRKSASTGP